jgi:hypothetical protein
MRTLLLAIAVAAAPLSCADGPVQVKVVVVTMF